jgi:hypothetical protein
MNDDEDLELQALQRQLDDAFQTTRPRAGFEDALWARMQARRPMWQRLRDFFSGLVESVRKVPAVPAAAVAVVLVLAIGVGVLSFSGFHFGGAGSTTSLSSGAQPGAAQNNFSGTAGFGRLPSPALQPVPVGDTGAPKASTPASVAPSVLYLGPANLVWTGRLYTGVTSAPVYRYQEPTSLDADRFAGMLGASSSTAAAGALGSYSGDGFVLAVAGSGGQPPVEPVFYLTPDRSRLPAAGPSPTETANAYLAAHNLVPTWPFVVVVEQYADFVRVNYLRQFVVPANGNAYLVNGSGARYGLAVDLRGGQPSQVVGPLPLNLEQANYPVIAGDQAVRSALQSKPATSGSIEPIPTVRLTSVELVYALAYAGDHGFYEPAYLFSGTFTHNGTTYLKRVLVPAIAS